MKKVYSKGGENERSWRASQSVYSVIAAGDGEGWTTGIEWFVVVFHIAGELLNGMDRGHSNQCCMEWKNDEGEK